MSATTAPVPTPADMLGRLASPLGLRLIAYAALALFAGLHWATLQAPASSWRMVACTAIALGAAGAVHASARLARRARIAVLTAVHVAAFALVLIAAGVPPALLDPERWGDLASGIGDGIGTLPTIGVPYRGVDPWVRIVLIAGGGLLLVAAGMLAVRALRRGRRPLGAALVLATAYVIPIVENEPSRPFLWGAAFTVLVGALLWGDRIERSSLAPAAVFVAVAVGGAMLASPRVDSEKPWLDYQAIVESLSTPPAVGFDWNHGYGPLDWPRENRVMLRVASKTPSYWKAVDLDTFDGVRWQREGVLPPGIATEVAPNHADWETELRVSVRDLRSSAYIVAGTGLEIRRSPRLVIPAAAGTFTTGRESLRRGDTYLSRVYTPNPSIRELRNAGTAYPPFVRPYLTMDLPATVGGPSSQIDGAPSTLAPTMLEFPQFSVLSARRPPTAYDPTGGISLSGMYLSESDYAPMYALAQRLRRDSDTPYEYVTAIQERLAEGYAYTEKPPAPRAGRPPLVSFLFDSRAGYCQQFSGAMALLLRMGGVPARIGSGFTPGTFDEGRGEWVVRDVDAHSWVEAYFPKLGWVTFDPTPGVAPPHTQLVNGPAPVDAPAIPLRTDGRRADVPERSPAAGAAAPDEGEVSFWTLLAGGLLAGSAVAAGAVAIRSRRNPGDLPAELFELDRALRMTGRPIDARLTLNVLEQRFAGHAPDAAGYVAAVRLARFGGRSTGPTPEQRVALRRELGSGLGWTGRLRAWWALPPLLRRPRGV